MKIDDCGTARDMTAEEERQWIIEMNEESRDESEDDVAQVENT